MLHCTVTSPSLELQSLIYKTLLNAGGFSRVVLPAEKKRSSQKLPLIPRLPPLSGLNATNLTFPQTKGKYDFVQRMHWAKPY